MLGEQIGESRGKRTGRRVLPTDAGFKVEISFEESGKMLGIEMNGFGTYTRRPGRTAPCTAKGRESS